MNKTLLTAKEVSKMLTVSKSAVYAYAQTGVLKAVRFPLIRPSQAVKQNRQTIRFLLEDVHQFLHAIGVDGFNGRGGE